MIMNIVICRHNCFIHNLNLIKRFYTFNNDNDSIDHKVCTLSVDFLSKNQISFLKSLGINLGHNYKECNENN